MPLSLYFCINGYNLQLPLYSSKVVRSTELTRPLRLQVIVPSPGPICLKVALVLPVRLHCEVLYAWLSIAFCLMSSGRFGDSFLERRLVGDKLGTCTPLPMKSTRSRKMKVDGNVND